MLGHRVRCDCVCIKALNLTDGHGAYTCLNWVGQLVLPWCTAGESLGLQKTLDHLMSFKHMPAVVLLGVYRNRSLLRLRLLSGAELSSNAACLSNHARALRSVQRASAVLIARNTMQQIVSWCRSLRWTCPMMRATRLTMLTERGWLTTLMSRQMMLRWSKMLHSCGSLCVKQTMMLRLRLQLLFQREAVARRTKAKRAANKTVTTARCLQKRKRTNPRQRITNRLQPALRVEAPLFHKAVQLQGSLASTQVKRQRNARNQLLEWATVKAALQQPN